MDLRKKSLALPSCCRIVRACAIGAGVSTRRAERVAAAAKGSLSRRPSGRPWKLRNGQAKAHFEGLGYAVDDSVHATEPYDMECRAGGEVLYVEVKASQNDGSQVLLTRNEVSFARDIYPRTALFVVHSLDVVADEADQPRAAGGHVRLIHPWRPADGALTALAYSCRLPPAVT